MASNQLPKKPVGRPKKHKTGGEAAKAVRESKLRWYHQSRQQSRQPAGPADFIAYEPLLHPGVPTETPPEIGLRTNINLPVISRDDTGDNDIPLYLRPISPPLTQLPTVVDDPELAEQIKQIRAGEQESIVEYDAEIAHILLGMRRDHTSHNTETSESQAIEETEVLPSGDAANGEDSQRSCLTQLSFAEESILWDNNSVAASYTSERSETISSARVQLHVPQTPSRRDLPVQTSSQTKRNSRPRAPLSSQKNTLLSWMTLLQTRSPVNTTSSSSITERLPSNTPSLPFYRVEGVASSLPIEPVIDITPAPALLTPSRTRVPVVIAVPDITIPDATVPDAIVPDATIPDIAAPDIAASPVPTEQTAFKLAKQLRNFQGCTHQQHREADQSHQEHHRRPDIHSQCSSLQRISGILRGSHQDRPLPDVLKKSKLMKPMDFAGLDYQAAFEGTSASAAPEEIGTRDEKLPRNLCLSQHYTTSRKNRVPKVSFDIDSTCCFPTSLAVACQGINWFPKVHPFLNLDADIHFGLKVPSYNQRGVLTQKYVPLHKIPHYCFGSVIGMESLLMFVFFPALHTESDYEHSTHLSKQDQELWYDAILGPAIHHTIQSSNILQHYPATARIAAVDSTALSAESLARKDSSREQLLKHALQPRYLDSLWSQILETIAENPACHRFHGASLFMHAKNTKLESMNVDEGLNAAYEGWAQSWSQATDSQFYNKDRTFVDLAKQTTSEDSALPYDQIPADHEAEVFLWKRCCLDTYTKTRTVLNPDGSPAKGNPKCTTYPWATMRDTVGQTFFAAPHGRESQDGLIYSQFYALIKTPFDTSKVYVFDNESLENLALDPGYIRSLQQEGRGITFSKGVCEFGYLHSKKRAYANLVDNQWKSYGIREEHRISLAMMEEIAQQWRQWDLYDDELDADQPLPYYIIPTTELLDFLYAQINKYCFLFEHVLAHTAMTYSLPETIMMATALRALRFCYGSNLLQRESLLYKDRWEHIRDLRPVVKEGLGMRDTMTRCGLGWFLPKINWMTWRLASPHGENILVGNLLMHEEYKRRWRAVKDLRDVYIRFNQAESWYDRYQVQHCAPLLTKWLEYLHVLNLEQFDTDIRKAMLKSHQRSPELTPDTIQQKDDIQFCYRAMKRMFSVDGVISPPHLVTGNKMRFERVADLLDFLFLWDDNQERRGWGNKPYRVILQKSFELIERRLGYRRAEKWFDEFFHLVRLTHWILPYPSNTAFLTTTKTSRTQGLKGRMMWFSAVYAHPDMVELPLRSHPITLYSILWNARRQTFSDGRDQRAWHTSQLISACRDQGLQVYGQDEIEEYWVVGKQSVGLKGFLPVWERTQPPRLIMLEQIRKKSLDELEDLMSGFSREFPHVGSEDNGSPIGRRRLGAEVGVDLRGPLAATSTARPTDDRSRNSELDESFTTITTVNSGSVFVPSGSDG